MTASASARPRLAIDQGLFVRVKGVEQWITLRGEQADNPALLILTGPGAAFSRLAPFFAPWERDFTLVQWDQPGAGATFARNGEAPLTLDGLAADAAEVARIACERLGAKQLVVLGVSGGSILGLKLIQARPDLVSAHVGTGQIVHWRRQQADGYRLALAAATGGGRLELEALGPPPYVELADEMVFSKHANGRTAAEQAEFAGLDADTAAALALPPAGVTYVPQGLTLPDGMARGLAGYIAVRDQIAAFDAVALGPQFKVPLVMLQGDADHYTPTAEVETWLAGVDAPAKTLALVSGGGHSALFLRQPFLAALNTHVRPLLGA